MNLKSYLDPDREKISTFLTIILILIIRGIHWMLPDEVFIQVPVLIISTIILLPAGILFYLASFVIQVKDDTLPYPFSNDILYLIYPFFIVYSYLLSCTLVHSFKHRTKEMIRLSAS